jgi:hypothetical protein
MNKASNFLSNQYLSDNTRIAFAAKTAKAEEVEGPASPNVELLRRVQRIVFSENVKTLDDAKSRLASLIDSLDDEEKTQKKPV